MQAKSLGQIPKKTHGHENLYRFYIYVLNVESKSYAFHREICLFLLFLFDFVHIPSSSSFKTTKEIRTTIPKH